MVKINIVPYIIRSSSTSTVTVLYRCQSISSIKGIKVLVVICPNVQVFVAIHWQCELLQLYLFGQYLTGFIGWLQLNIRCKHILYSKHMSQSSGLHRFSLTMWEPPTLLIGQHSIGIMEWFQQNIRCKHIL